MENRYFIITPEERQIVETRTAEVVNSLNEETPIGECLQAYAAENGLTEEEARQLVCEEIIPTVNEYNASCRQASEQGAFEWVQERISERVEDMSLAEEVRYKITFLQALHRMDQEILRHEELLEGQSWESCYDELSAGLPELPADEDITEEMLRQTNEALAESIENSQLALYHSAAFTRLVECELDEKTVRTIAFDLWRDESYKYCAATAACVAHRKGELPSISEDTSAYVITLGVCQGIDVEQIEQKVAFGEMAADAAFEILRVIGMVALGLLGVYLGITILSAAVVGGELLSLVMGGGILAFIAAVGVSYCTLCGVLSHGAEVYAKFVGFLSKKAETTYKALKDGAKQLHQRIVEKVVPCIQQCCERAVQFFRKSVDWIRRRTGRVVMRSSHA